MIFDSEGNSTGSKEFLRQRLGNRFNNLITAYYPNISSLSTVFLPKKPERLAWLSHKRKIKALMVCIRAGYPWEPWPCLSSEQALADGKVLWACERAMLSTWITTANGFWAWSLPHSELMLPSGAPSWNLFLMENMTVAKYLPDIRLMRESFQKSWKDSKSLKKITPLPCFKLKLLIYCEKKNTYFILLQSSFH